jgi:hypothetical protein
MFFENIEKNFYMPSKKLYASRAGVIMRDYENIDKTILKKLDEIYFKGLELSEPRIYFKTFGIKEVELNLIPEVFDKNIKQITFFVSTLGEKIDNYISDEENVLIAFFMDSWASEALESLNENFDKYLKEKYDKKSTIRFSPGYPGLDIIYNYHILKFLNINFVRSNEKTGILIPRKSSVCILGWY